jgi:acyl-CoA thioesterase FadM
VIIENVFLHDQVPDELEWNLFPEPLPATSGVFVIKHQTEWRDIDPFRHLNNAVYLTDVENLLIQIGSVYGRSVKHTLDVGCAFIVRWIRIQYL